MNPMKPTPGRLEKFAWKKYTISVYGDGEFAPAVCRALVQRGFAGGVLVDYRVPSSAMEPTLHCARPAICCLGNAADLVGVQVNGASSLKRFDIVVFKTPPEGALRCGEGGTSVKRVIGLPGDTVREDDHGFIWIRSAGAETFLKLSEPYVSASRRLADSSHFGELWYVPMGEYFVLGDNRAQSCDSRAWGSLPAHDVTGPVVKLSRNGAFLRPSEFLKQIEGRS
jgi:signal peptidase I